jgi:hypothetical protein
MIAIRNMKSTMKRTGFLLVVLVSLILTTFFSVGILENLRFLHARADWELNKRAVLEWNEEKERYVPEIRITPLIDETHILLYFSPGCGSCVEDLEGLKEVYDEQVLPLAGLNSTKMKYESGMFDKQIKGDEAYNLGLLYGLSLSGAVFVDDTGRILKAKRRDETLKSFYIAALELMEGEE